MRHTVAWLIWVTGAATAAFMIRNPLYLTLIALSAWLVYVTVERGSSTLTGWRGLLKIGALIWLVTIPFNALMVHQGEHVLFSLPRSWPLIGGNITAESVLMGLVTGYALWTLLLIFATFNLAVDASQLLRLTPPFLYQAGVVTSIALTFMPQMLASAKEIREAQQIRGHRFRGWRDSLPLFVPLLTTGFEQAIQLAESMESRGFGGDLEGLSRKETNKAQWGMLLGLVLLVCGLLARAFWADMGLLGLGIMICAGLLLARSLHVMGRRVQRSRYRRSHWRYADTIIALVGALVVAGIMLIRAEDKFALIYYPYPPYSLIPEFDAWIGVLLALLAIPGLVVLFGEADMAQPAVQKDSPRDSQ